MPVCFVLCLRVLLALECDAQNQLFLPAISSFNESSTALRAVNASINWVVVASKSAQLSANIAVCVVSDFFLMALSAQGQH